jgi:hypothetical protein
VSFYRLKLCETFATDGTTAEAHGSDAESSEFNCRSFLNHCACFTTYNAGVFVDYTQLFCELISNVVSGQIGHDEVVQLLAENIIVVCEYL